jgi:hypothetical protein
MVKKTKTETRFTKPSIPLWASTRNRHSQTIDYFFN